MNLVKSLYDRKLFCFFKSTKNGVVCNSFRHYWIMFSLYMILLCEQKSRFLNADRVVNFFLRIYPNKYIPINTHSLSWHFIIKSLPSVYGCMTVFGSPDVLVEIDKNERYFTK